MRVLRTQQDQLPQGSKEIKKCTKKEKEETVSLKVSKKKPK